MLGCTLRVHKGAVRAAAALDVDMRGDFLPTSVDCPGWGARLLQPRGRAEAAGAGSPETAYSPLKT